MRCQGFRKTLIGWLGLAWWAMSAAAVAAEQALIAVAANFAEVVERLEGDFERETGHRIDMTVGSTGKLYAQIRSGAPFDVLLAADQARPERLEADGDAVRGSRFTYASGRLVLWSADPDRIGPDGAATLRAGQFRRLAIANPDLAPYGLAAVQTLEALGLRASLADRMVMGESIGQAHAMVATGNAELGLVALAQVASPRQAAPGSRWDVPAALHQPIRQDAVLLSRAEDNSAARDFMAYLRRDDVRQIIAGFGYEVDTPDRQAGPRLEFSQARVREPIPGQDKTVGYFNVTNQGGRPVTLVGARADGVRAIEMHTTLHEDGMARMRRLPEVVVAPGETVAFEPGGRHLMLFGVAAVPETLIVVLVTAGGDEIAVPFARFALGG
ncbi:MAG: molybdate ABC transporter substrate-binding protein [Pseudomonadales bacterium]